MNHRNSATLLVATCLGVALCTLAEAWYDNYTGELGGKLSHAQSQEGLEAKLQACEALLKEYKDPADAGVIYTVMCEVCADWNMLQKDPKARRYDRVIEYARKAAASPIDAISRAKAYMCWHGALWQQAPPRGTVPYAKARAEFAVPLLKGLKVLFDSELLSGKSLTPTGDPDADRRASDDRRWAGLACYSLQSMLADAYSSPPYDLEELRKLAETILKDKGRAASLVEETKAAIQRKTGRKPKQEGR